ncbi:methyltransferase [Actinomadura sp. 9N215]|uniref:methyltransferase n=1 Tax=Actinomadura sp. 9N215 TaxID=3375150 RepID=UPI00378FF9A0
MADSGRDAYAYQPTLPAEQAERIRRWHDVAYRRGKARGRTTRRFGYLDTVLEVPPDVHPVTDVSHLLGEAVLAEVRAGDAVLDMGTGSGVNAVLAASKAAAVVAVDVNPVALDAARRNAANNGVPDRVEVRYSDVFSHVDETFDLIVFDPPFRWFAPRERYELAYTDHNYRALTRFFREARDHLSPAGRMLILFTTAGDIDYLRRLADENGFTTEVVAHQRMMRDDWPVDYYSFRMTI